MTLFRYLLIAAVVLGTPMVVSTPVEAKQIEKACNASDRRTSRRLCKCIQGVANQLLTSREQREAAGFFKEPHRAQELRTSDNSRDEDFWKRYKQFGALASQRCN